MEHIIGHLVNLLMTFRLGLAMLSHCYAFVQQSYFQKQSVWPSAKKELWMIRALCPLFKVSLLEDPYPWIYCVDAAPGGYAVVRSLGAAAPVREALDFSERW
eukprot:2928583-Karenia_brevis.AAC.1